MRGRTDKLPRCGFPMPLAKEPCARMAGHQPAYDHRTRYALDNLYRASMGREPDPYVLRDGEWVRR